jgi:hypothetical protein
LGAWGIDPALAYLSTDRLTMSPWATAYRVELPRPFSRKSLTEVLRRRRARDVVLKMRGFAGQPEAMRRQLRRGLDPEGGVECPVVFLTRLGGRAVMFLGERLGAGIEAPGA